MLHKGLDSLVLSTEHFNRASDRGRTSAVLILLDHSFEMLLKASILHSGGKIRESNSSETIGFDKCIRIAISDAKIKFLTENEALGLQTINGLRDAAQHHLIDVSEQQLYLHSRSGITLFRDILKRVFGQDLSDYLPTRVLPISTMAPTDLVALFDHETTELRNLLGPGKRRRLQAYARLRPLAILDATVRGRKLQPSNDQLSEYAGQLSKGIAWSEVFPGAASVQFTVEGTGPNINLRLTKKEGIETQIVPEGTPGASVIALKRVNELDFYNLGRDKLAEHVGLSGPRTTAVIWHSKLQRDEDCFKEFSIGKTRFKRYSQRAIDHIRAYLEEHSIEEIWEEYKLRDSTAIL